MAQASWLQGTDWRFSAWSSEQKKKKQIQAEAVILIFIHTPACWQRLGTIQKQLLNEEDDLLLEKKESHFFQYYDLHALI